MSHSAIPGARGTVYQAFEKLEGDRHDQNQCPPLCTGPYQDYVSSIAALLPNVAGSDPRNKSGPLEKRRASVKLLSFGKDSKPNVHDFKVAADLKVHFDQREQAAKAFSSDSPKRHIYLLEGLNAEFVAALGEYFYMDPSFFVEHEVISRWNKDHLPPRLTEPLPSLVYPRSNFCLPYYELLHSKKEIKDFQYNCHQTGRHIAITRMDAKYQRQVVVRRKCSFWSCKNGDGGWDVVILTDPPILTVIQDDSAKMDTEPFQGGYLDFIPLTSHPANLLTGPPRKSMCGDLVHYWTVHHSIFLSLSSPEVTTLFMRKIAASHYMQLVQWVGSVISTQEWSLSRRDNLETKITSVEAQWSDLQALNRRCGEYCEDVERIMLALNISKTYLAEDEDWMSSSKDFRYILERLQVLKARCEVLIISITALTGIAGNRQALTEAKRQFREAKNIKLLTLIGMVFLPLAFVCALFSMNETYLPGSSQFWVYWASAVPLMLSVFIGSNLANRGYDDTAGTWNLTNIWHIQTRGARNKSVEAVTAQV